MAKRGRKNAYETNIKPRFSEICDWLKHGATERQIAYNLGVAYSTFNHYKANVTEFSELLKNGRQSLVLELRGALVKKALGYRFTEIKKYTKIENGNAVQYVEETTKESAPDVAALNLCLKNYDSESWANDPQLLKLKREELALKRELADNNNW